MNGEKLKIAIFGGRGRMGQTLRGLLDDHPRMLPWAVLEQASNPDTLADCDAAIDFTVAAAAPGHAEACAQRGIPMVIGTTGLDAGHEAELRKAAEIIPIVYSANMSIGINLLSGLVQQAAARLGPDYDIEIMEMHHNRKIDAPSGTALMLGRSAALGRGQPLEALRAAPRDGRTGARVQGQIGFSSLRGGDVPGEHTVYFAGESERLELTHRAGNRVIFARGALRAAEWIAGHEPGLYSMQDVLEIGD